MAYTQGGSPVTGAKGINQFLTARLKYDLDQAELYEIAPDETPWLTMSLQVLRKPTTAREFRSFANNPSWVRNRFFAAGAGTWSSNAIANLSVDDGAGNAVGFLKAGLLIRINHTSENDTLAVITNVDSQTQIDLRSVGSNETNVANNDQIQVIGTAYGDTSSASTAVNSVLASNSGYAQDFESAWSMTDTSEAEEVFGPDEWVRLSKETLRTHKTDINRAGLWGEGDVETITISGESTRVFLTDGAITFAQTNSSTLMNGAGVQSPNFSSYTYNSFVDDMSNLFALGSNARLAVCGSGPIAFFSKIGTGSFLSGAQVEVRQVNEFGLTITKIRTPFGVLNLFMDKAIGFGHNDGWYENYMVCIDPDYARYRPFIGKGKSFDTHLLTNTQAKNQIRTRRYAYRTVAGFEYNQPATHGLFTFS